MESVYLDTLKLVFAFV